MPQPLNKQQASAYGKLVEAAYNMYQNKNNPDPLRPEPLNYIDSAYELSAWVHMSDFILGDEELKFYGIVVHSTADPTLRIIAIRGTDAAVEWFDDATALPVPFRQVPSAGRVATGFDKIYSTMKVVKYVAPAAIAAGAATETYSGSFADQLEQLAISREAEFKIPKSAAKNNLRPERPTVVTGHSLGGALATLFVMENDFKKKFDVTTLCTYASPRVGDLEFVNKFNLLPINSWRVVNVRDIVPKLPPHIPLVFEYGHVDTAYPFDSKKFETGFEPIWQALATYHALTTYLYWLDHLPDAPAPA